jgi:hypothetical protein
MLTSKGIYRIRSKKWYKNLVVKGSYMYWVSYCENLP